MKYAFGSELFFAITAENYSLIIEDSRIMPGTKSFSMLWRVTKMEKYYAALNICISDKANW